MKKLITAGHSWRVMHMGLDQEFVIGSIIHSDINPNITGKYETWVPLEEFEKVIKDIEVLKNLSLCSGSSNE